MVNKMNGESVDLTAQNIARLKELFPEILTDGEKIDFDMLKTVLGGNVDSENERYQFTWHGKKKMIAGTQKPSRGTLRPDKEKSKNFDTTENLYIEGDNLEVLKLLQKSYNGKIKMIYIDPPYNTGKDFVYKDNFKDGVQNYLEQTGQVDSEGNILSTNAESNGRFHTDWLNMIYARLNLARNLLTEDGLIFISIDDNEFGNLKRVSDEIFGESNATVPLIWQLPRGINAGLISRAHEYILCYAKNINKVKHFNRLESKIEYSIDRCNKKIDVRHPASEITFPAGIKYVGEDKVFENKIEGSEEIFIEGQMVFENNKLKYPVALTAGWTMKNMINKWLKGEEVFDSKGQKILEFFFKENGKLYSKKEVNTYSIKSVLKGIPDTQIAREELQNLFGSQDYFSYPKTKELIKLLLKLVSKDNDIILDFFSGSATTAHATMQLNAEDCGNRKFIMVQLPEPLDEKSEAYKDGYRTICDIGEERIRRAGEKIKAELIEKQQNSGMLDENVVDPESIDIGFKVLKLDTSNIREWNVDFADLENKLDLYDTPFVENRSEVDVVYEIMLKQGLELTYPIETFEINGQTVYDIAFGSLFICLSKKITTDIAQAIIARRDEQGSDTSSVIFSDAGFTTDSDKLNCIEILKDAGYPEDNLLTL